MKSLLIGDLHIDNAKNSISNSDSFLEILNLFTLIKNSAHEHRVDYVIFLGDVFNVPISTSSTILSAISELVNDLSMEVPIIFIEGNHDIVDDKHMIVKNGENRMSVKASLLTPFKFFNNVKVFSNPEVVNIEKNIEIAFIPFSNNINEDLDRVSKKFSVGSKRILMGHFDIRNNFYLQDGGNPAFNNKLPNTSDLIEKYKYDIVLLGHIHEPEEFLVNEKLVKYVGSSRNINFSNIGEKKGIHLFDFDTFELTFIENEHTNIFKTFKDVDELKKFCYNKTPEELSKTKIKYVYSSSADMKSIGKLKEFFKTLQFEKNIVVDEEQSGTISVESLSEFENLIKDNLMTKDKIVEYAIQFKEPENVEEMLNMFNMVVR